MHAAVPARRFDPRVLVTLLVALVVACGPDEPGPFSDVVEIELRQALVHDDHARILELSEAAWAQVPDGALPPDDRGPGWFRLLGLAGTRQAGRALEAYDELARRGVRLTFCESMRVVRLLCESAGSAELPAARDLLERVPATDAEQLATSRALSEEIAERAAELELIEELMQCRDCSEFS